MRRVDVVDPGADGTRIGNALRDEGLSVDQRTLESLVAEGTDATLLVLAGDAAGAVDAVRSVRAAPRSTAIPIVLVGSPVEGPLKERDLVRLGADAYLPRPVNVPLLIEKVRTLLAAAPAAPMREPTVRLPSDSAASRLQSSGSRPLDVEVSRPAAPPPAPAAAEERPREPTRRLTDPGAAGTRPSTPPDAGEERRESTFPGHPFSPQLVDLLREADRRLFPDESPVELRYAIGDESAAELVSDDLLEAFEMPIEPVEDPLEAFTFIGGAPAEDVTPLPLLEAERGRVSAPPPPPPGPVDPLNTVSPTEGPETVHRRVDRRGPPSSGAAAIASADASGEQLVTLDAIDVGDPTADGRGRRGELADAAGLLVLGTLARRQADARVSLSLGDRIGVALLLERGRVVGFDGPASLRATDALRRDGVLRSIPEDDDEARVLLEQRIGAGLLDRFDVDRRLARAREELLHDVVAARGGTFLVLPVDDFGSGRAAPRASFLRGTLLQVLFEGARRRLDAERVRRLLAPGGLLSLTPDADALFEELGLEPEVVTLLERIEGSSLDDAVGTAPPVVGLSGLLFALTRLGGLRLAPPTGAARGAGPASDAARRMLEAAHRLARDGDYFSVLGARPDSTARELRAAYEERRRHLVSLAVDGSASLARMRDEAIDALDEAVAVLADDRLREAYRAALAGSPD